MRQQLIKSINFFQHILYSNFRHLNAEGVEVLLMPSIGHLFGLYNPNQIADALEIPKAKLYRQLQHFSQEDVFEREFEQNCLAQTLV